MPNTLGLDDDLDPVEIVISVERAFGLKLSDAEAAACRNVGDLHDLLRSRFADRRDAPGGCVTAMAFHRLRRALAHVDPSAELRPDTRLADVGPPRSLLATAATFADLRAPAPALTSLGGAGACAVGGEALGLMVGLLVAGTVPALFWFFPISLLVAGSIAILLDPRKIPAECETLGDLTRRAAGLNFGKLVAGGARPRERDVWAALVEVLAEHSGTPRADIRRDTLFLKSQLRSA